MWHVSVAGVEALVSWLLDHPDVHVTEVSDADTVSDEYSEEEVLEELDESETAFPVVGVASPLMGRWLFIFFGFVVEIDRGPCFSPLVLW